MTEDDEQYKKATKAVDDAMRTDTLGPQVCKVLKEHLPTDELLEEKVAKFINSGPNVKRSLNDYINDNQTIQRGRWLERGGILLLGGLLSWLGQFVISQLSK